VSTTCPAGNPSTVRPWVTAQRMFCVNRSTISVPVFLGVPFGVVGPGGCTTQIGTIQPNDYFRWQDEGRRVTGSPEEHQVLIRNAGGQLQWGFIGSSQVDVNKHAIFSAIWNFQRTNFTWNGMNLREYAIWNRPAALRSRSGGLIETLPAGTRIGVGPTLGDAVMGQDWCTFWRVATVVRSPGGVVQWTWANMNPNEHAFVDVGLPNNRPTTSSIRTSLA
jgi:hypothetical protein